VSFAVSVRQCRYDNRSDSFRLIRAICFCFLSNLLEKVNAGKIELAESERDCDVSWSGIYGNKEEGI
jgi:hypothetical protein